MLVALADELYQLVQIVDLPGLMQLLLGKQILDCGPELSDRLEFKLINDVDEVHHHVIDGLQVHDLPAQKPAHLTEGTELKLEQVVVCLGCL